MFANELAEPNKSLSPIARKRANYISFVVVVFNPDESHVARRTPDSEARRKLTLLLRSISITKALKC